jgi:hypothetical protein
MRFVARHPWLATILLSLPFPALPACGGSNDEPLTLPGAMSAPLPFRGTEHARREVIDGARRDFDVAIQGPPGFERCFIARFRRELTRERLEELVITRDRRGEPAAARALNGLGAPVGDVCGGREHVPQLIEAATGLRSKR